MVRLLTRCLALALALVVLIAAATLVAQSAVPKAQTPVLVTSCGQSPGPARVKVFLQRLQMDYEMKDTATVKDLAAKPYKTLIVVTGASLKGMGAAGVSITDEIARVNALMADAKKKGITVIGAHVEGMERRAKGAAAGRQLRRAVDRRRLPEVELPHRAEGRRRRRPLHRVPEEEHPRRLLREEQRAERRPPKRLRQVGAAP